MSTAACIEKIFPGTLSHPVAADLFSESGDREAFEKEPEKFAEFLRTNFPYPSSMAFLAELAAVEYACWSVEHMEQELCRPAHGAVINPLLRIVPVNNDVTPFFSPGTTLPAPGEIEPYEGFVLVWKGPESGKLYVEKADEQMLLALKALSEEQPGLRGHELRVVNQAIDYSAREGVVLKAPYLVSRARQGFPEGENIPQRYTTASVFTLQWHITNACDLYCRHCYDREKRSPLTAKEGFRIIDDFDLFCREMNVRGHICFSGGNPFMSPHFYHLYEAAAEKGFALSLLGNPVPAEELQRVIDRSTPEYFQVSLEGLEAHNDFIRGEGFYRRVMDFLSLLRKKQVPSAVMLTLTKANIDQILPLAEALREKTDYFTFNRLSQVGEGAGLSLPDRQAYRRFLESYTAAAGNNPVIGLKDNLINILRERRGIAPFGGCTGFGCGAAFNFVALLPDGEVHACRKFPSLIGNILESDFMTLYESEEAQRFRMGPESCSECRLRPVCGGCMAVVHGMGLDPFLEKDPFCFLDE
ncbi:MAG: thio(seleno)oxazole modification radical SAM maturase SbtM [Chlorobiales bacterium]|nr:thio(seleno)oxazole modification radical SAM maturase SbtM [Chlorobiales bacterium]